MRYNVRPDPCIKDWRLNSILKRTETRFKRLLIKKENLNSVFQMRVSSTKDKKQQDRCKGHTCDDFLEDESIHIIVRAVIHNRRSHINYIGNAWQNDVHDDHFKKVFTTVYSRGNDFYFRHDKYESNRKDYSYVRIITKLEGIKDSKI